MLLITQPLEGGRKCWHSLLSVSHSLLQRSKEGILPQRRAWGLGGQFSHAANKWWKGIWTQASQFQSLHVFHPIRLSLLLLSKQLHFLWTWMDFHLGSFRKCAYCSPSWGVQITLWSNNKTQCCRFYRIYNEQGSLVSAVFSGNWKHIGWLFIWPACLKRQ